MLPKSFRFPNFENKMNDISLIKDNVRFFITDEFLNKKNENESEASFKLPTIRKIEVTNDFHLSRILERSKMKKEKVNAINFRNTNKDMNNMLTNFKKQIIYKTAKEIDVYSDQNKIMIKEYNDLINLKYSLAKLNSYLFYSKKLAQNLKILTIMKYSSCNKTDLSEEKREELLNKTISLEKRIEKYREIEEVSKDSKERLLTILKIIQLNSSKNQEYIDVIFLAINLI